MALTRESPSPSTYLLQRKMTAVLPWEAHPHTQSMSFPLPKQLCLRSLHLFIWCVLSCPFLEQIFFLSLTKLPTLVPNSLKLKFIVVSEAMTSVNSPEGRSLKRNSIGCWERHGFRLKMTMKFSSHQPLLTWDVCFRPNYKNFYIFPVIIVIKTSTQRKKFNKVSETQMHTSGLKKVSFLKI